MKIGIIGAHIVGMRLAQEFAAAGHDVLITTSRGREGARDRLEQAGASPAIEPASMAEVVGCEIVVLAAPWVRREEVLKPSIAWNGRILIDATNIYLSYPPNYRRDDLGDGTGSEIIARLAPGARVVKAFNTLPFSMMFAPAPSGMRRVLFAAGNNREAVATVCGLIEQLGFHPVAFGNLAAGRLMELEAPLSMLDAYTRTSGRAHL